MGKCPPLKYCSNFVINKIGGKSIQNLLKGGGGEGAVVKAPLPPVISPKIFLLLSLA